EPAAATRAPGYRAELLAAFGEAPANVVFQFCRERTRADAGGVRLDDAEHLVESPRADPGPGRGSAGQAVGTRYERIGAMVDVEQGALRSLEQQAFTTGHRLGEQGRDIGNHRGDPGRQRERLVGDFVDRQWLCAEIALEDEVVQVHDLREPFAKAYRLEQVLQPQRPARDLVFVGRADAAAGGADLGVAAARLARLVDGDVVRED